MDLLTALEALIKNESTYAKGVKVIRISKLEDLVAQYQGPDQSIHDHRPTVPACRETWVEGEGPRGECAERS